MKSAFCMNVFSNEDMADAIKKIGDIGYDGLEFWDQYLIQTDINELSLLLKEKGLKTAQVCPYFNVTGTDQELRNTLKITEEYIQIAKTLDSKFIRVFTGNVSSKDATASQYSQAVDGLQTMCKMGEKEALVFVLETHEGSLMDTSMATIKLLNDVNMSNLKVNLQIPLGYGKEDIFETATLLADHVVHVHAHNWIGGWPNLTYLGSGDYSFEKFMDILLKKGYHGYISIEHANHLKNNDPYEVAIHEREYLKNQFGI